MPSDRTDLVNLISPCPGTAFVGGGSSLLHESSIGPNRATLWVVMPLVNFGPGVWGNFLSFCYPEAGSQGKWQSKMEGGTYSRAPWKILLAYFWSLILNISHNASVLCLEVGFSLLGDLQSLEPVSLLMIEVHCRGVCHNCLHPTSGVGECSHLLLLGSLWK